MPTHLSLIQAAEAVRTGYALLEQHLKHTKECPASRCNGLEVVEPCTCFLRNRLAGFHDDLNRLDSAIGTR